MELDQIFSDLLVVEMVWLTRVQTFLFYSPPQENWDEDDEKEEQSDEQDMTVEKEINGDSDLEPENESEEE